MPELMPSRHHIRINRIINAIERINPCLCGSAGMPDFPFSSFQRYQFAIFGALRLRRLKIEWTVHFRVPVHFSYKKYQVVGFVFWHFLISITSTGSFWEAGRRLLAGFCCQGVCQRLASGRGCRALCRVIGHAADCANLFRPWRGQNILLCNIE
jgi:hypothetical protein